MWCRGSIKDILIGHHTFGLDVGDLIATGDAYDSSVHLFDLGVEQRDIYTSLHDERKREGASRVQDCTRLTPPTSTSFISQYCLPDPPPHTLHSSHGSYNSERIEPVDNRIVYDDGGILFFQGHGKR